MFLYNWRLCQCNYSVDRERCYFSLGLKIKRKLGKPLSLSRTHLFCFDRCFIHVFSVSSRLLLQLTTEAHAAETSMAFGCSLKSCRHLLEAARELGVQVVGVTFHIPSSCQDLQQAYTHALSDARCVFDMGVSAVWKISLVNMSIHEPQCLFISWNFFFVKDSNTVFACFHSGGSGLQHEHSGHWWWIYWLRVSAQTGEW